MTITYVNGDLFAANERAIAHGCNCHGVMGAGVARLVQDQFPKAYREYRRACQEDQFYPGVAQPVECHVDELDHRIGDVTTIYNLATQNAPGANGDIEFIERALRNMKAHMDYVGNRRVAMPKIGAGIARVPWEWTELRIALVFGVDDAYDIVVYEL